MPEPLTPEYLKECEYRARRFASAYTGTSGTLAGMVLHLLAEVRRLRVDAEAINVTSIPPKSLPQSIV